MTKLNTNVTDPVVFRKAIIEEVEESLRDAVYSFAGKVTVAEIIGIMEVLKYELLKGD